MSKATIPEMIAMIQECLSEDLLKPEYQRLNHPSNLYGHCYIATEALYHLLGGNCGEYKPVRAQDHNSTVHWWLEHKHAHPVITLDPTADQYYSCGFTPPYHKGIGGGFLTREPSLRTKELLCRVWVLARLYKIDLTFKP